VRIVAGKVKELGREFEEKLREKEKENDKFRFLRDKTVRTFAPLLLDFIALGRWLLIQMICFHPTRLPSFTSSGRVSTHTIVHLPLLHLLLSIPFVLPCPSLSSFLPFYAPPPAS
jgi:hypothetical protein